MAACARGGSLSGAASHDRPAPPRPAPTPAGGFALVDVISQVAKSVVLLGLPNDALRFIMSHLADIEHRLAFGTSDKIQGAAFVGAFAAMRVLLEAAKRM